ncbi:MAG: cytochrome C [Rhodobacteraceae bacterium]|nr:cytochrome C [Paracoccaceae bacterium]MCF8514226.1 cytochrome C [Paracoccaceae bacterium]MCF8518470.1 cytochrome C [Paracoccaceae bacterium]
MKLTMTALSLVTFAIAAPAFAEELTGDAEAGAKVFAKCQTCHVVQDADGNVLAGKNAKVGPDLWGMPGRVAGTFEGFKYGKSIVALGETGFVWDEASFVEYVADPAKFLKAKLDDKGAKSLMSFKLPKEADAKNVYAFIASLSPAPAEAAPATN